MDDLRRPPGPLAALDHDGKVLAPWELSDRTGAIVLFALVPAILVFDFLSVRDYSLHLFYLVPTGLAAWNFGARPAYAVAAIAGLYWAWVGYGIHYPHAAAGTLAWDVASTVALFLFFAWVIARHRRLHDALVESARLDLASGALSKREVLRLFDIEVRRSRRYKRPLALVLFDAAGEKDWKGRSRDFMAAVVRGAQQDIRASDSIGRVAERRLAIVLVECAAEEAVHVAGRVQGRLGDNLKSPAPAMGVVSFGGAGPLGAAELLEVAADQLARARVGTGIADKRIP